VAAGADRGVCRRHVVSCCSSWSMSDGVWQCVNLFPNGLSARQQQGRATTGLGHRMQRQRRGRVHLANIWSVVLNYTHPPSVSHATSFRASQIHLVFKFLPYQIPSRAQKKSLRGSQK
jgi:hypothetical protein